MAFSFQHADEPLSRTTVNELNRLQVPCFCRGQGPMDGDIFGDGVNVAARLEGIAEPGGICDRK